VAPRPDSILFDEFLQALSTHALGRGIGGRFGPQMAATLVNEGPAVLMLQRVPLDGSDA